MFYRDSSNNTIKFYYNRDTLFNDVSLMSNFMAKNLATKEGNSLTDDFAISDDERDLFGVCVQQTLPDIYESMAKITNGVNNAFEDAEVGVIADEVYLEAGSTIPSNTYYEGSTQQTGSFTQPYHSEDGTMVYLKSTYASGTASGTIHYFKITGQYVTFILQENAAYNVNILNLVDASLNNTLKQGVLREFYSIVIQPEFFKVCAERFISELFKLKQRLFQLKKKSVSTNLT